MSGDDQVRQWAWSDAWELAAIMMTDSDGGSELAEDVAAADAILMEAPPLHERPSIRGEPHMTMSEYPLAALRTVRSDIRESARSTA